MTPTPVYFLREGKSWICIHFRSSKPPWCLSRKTKSSPPRHPDLTRRRYLQQVFPDSKVHGGNMGPIWGRQDPSGPHVGPMNLAIWVVDRVLAKQMKYSVGFWIFSLFHKFYTAGHGWRIFCVWGIQYVLLCGCYILMCSVKCFVLFVWWYREFTGSIQICRIWHCD